MSKHIILWGGWYGSKNMGDQALLLAITNLLGFSYPDAQFTVLTANPSHVRLYAARDSKFAPSMPAGNLCASCGH